MEAAINIIKNAAISSDDQDKAISVLTSEDALKINNMNNPLAYIQSLLSRTQPTAQQEPTNNYQLLVSPRDEIADELETRTVLIRVSTPNHGPYSIGSGVRVGGRLILTCRHVAIPKEYTEKQTMWNRIADKSKLIYEVGIYKPRAVWCRASELSISEDFDLALLELETHGMYKNQINDISTIQIPGQHSNLRLKNVCMCGYPARITRPMLNSKDILEFQPPFPSIKRGYISADRPQELEINISGEPGFSGSGLVFTETGRLLWNHQTTKPNKLTRVHLRTTITSRTLG